MMLRRNRQNIGFAGKYVDMGLILIIKRLLGRQEDPSKVGVETLLQNLEKRGLCREDAKDTVVYMFMKESQKLKNKKAVDEKAQAINGGFQEEDVKKVDEEWLSRFYRFAEDVSDETMQNLWAQILAGEVKTPKSYSLRTLDFVRLLSSEEAKIYADSVKYVCFKNLMISDNGFGISFNNKMTLVDLGILLAEDLTYTVKVRPNKREILPLDNNYILMLNSNNSNEISIKFNVRKMTKVGMELLPLIDIQNNFDLYDYVAKKVKSAGVTSVSLHKLISASEDGTFTYVPLPEKVY